MGRDASRTGLRAVNRQVGNLPHTGVKWQVGNVPHCAVSAVLVLTVLVPLAAPAQQPGAVRYWEGHSAAVYAVAWSADGKTVASGGADREMRVWDAETGKGVRTLVGFARPVLSVALSQDGLRMMAGDASGSAKLFDTPLTRPVAELGTMNNRPTALAVALDASWLLGGDAGGGVRLWLVGAQVATRDFGGASGEVTAVAMLATPQHVLASTADGSLYGWNAADAAATGKLLLPRSNGLCPLAGGTMAAAGDDGVLRLVAWPPAALAGPVAHNDQVNAVAVSADGRLLATASNDTCVRIVPVATNEGARSVSIGSGAVTSAAFTFDGQVAVAGTQGGAVRLWSTADGAERGTLAGHAGAVRAVAAHPKTVQIASAGEDGTIRIWDAPLAARVMAGHAQGITALAIAADGAAAVTASADKTVRLWSLDRSVATPEIKRFDLPEVPTAVAVGRDGKRLAVGDAAGAIRLLDVGRGETAVLPEAQPGGVTAIDLHPQQPIALTAGPDGTVKLWDIAASPPKPLTGRAPIATDHKRVSRVVFLPDGQHFLTAGEDARAKLWDMTGKLLRPYANCWSPIRFMAVSSDGKFLAAASDPSTNNKSVYVWNFGDGTIKREIATPSGAAGLAFSPDGTRLAVGGPDGRVRVYRLADGLLLEEISLAGPPSDVLFAADGRTLVAAVGPTPVVLRQSLVESMSAHMGPVTALVYSPDGTRLFSAGADKTIRQWDPAGWKEVRRLAGSAEAPLALAASEEGGWVAAGGSDKTLRLWKVLRNSPAEVPPSLVLAQPAGVRGVALGRDGRTAATACDDALVRVWDVPSGCLLESLAGHAGQVTAVAFLPDGLGLASGSTDRSMRRWARSVARAVKAHNGPIRAVAASPDGSTLFTSSDDGSAAQWAAGDLRLVRRYDAGEKAMALGVDPGGGALAVAAGREVRAWKTSDGRSLGAIALPAPATSVAVADGGARIVAGGADGVVRHYALAGAGPQPAWRLALEVPAHPEPVTALALAADGRTLFSAGAEKAVRRWLAGAIAPRAEIAAHRGPVFAVQFSPDGSRLVSAGGDGAARMWESNPGRLVAELEGGHGQVLDVAFSADGKRLATCGTDRAVRIYEAGKLVRTLQDGFPDALAAVVFSPDGAWMAAAGRSGKWYGWTSGDARPQRTVVGHFAPLARIAVNRTGSKLATLDLAGQLFFWNTDGSPVWHQQLPVQSAYGLAWSPDGKQVALATSDKRLLVLTVPPAAQ